MELQQQTDLAIAMECPPMTIQLKQDLPLCILAQSCVPDCHNIFFQDKVTLFDIWNEFKRQQHKLFQTSLSQNKQQSSMQ